MGRNLSINAVGGQAVIRQFLIDNCLLGRDKFNVGEIMAHFELHKRHLGKINGIIRALGKSVHGNQPALELIGHITPKKEGFQPRLNRLDCTQYKPIREIHSGNSTVYLAEKLQHPNKGEIRTLKFIPDREKSKKEIELNKGIAKLLGNKGKNKYLTPLLEHYAVDGGYCMVYNTNKGGSLLDREGEFNIQVAFAQIVFAVKTLHSEAFVHRDLKPQNIMFSADGHVSLIDLDLGKFHSQSTRYDFSGTPEYMALEIYRQEKIVGNYHSSIDYWALGCILFELYTGTTLNSMMWATNEEYGHTEKGDEDQEARWRKWNEALMKVFNSEIPDIPEQPDATDIVRNLCQVNVERRMNFAANIENHKYFEGIDWREIENKTVQPPLKTNNGKRKKSTVDGGIRKKSRN